MTSADTESMLARAIKAHRSGRLKEADKIYDEILILEPSNGNANHNRGVLKVAQRNFAIAEIYFEEALKCNLIKPQYWESYIQLLIETKQLSQANKCLKTSIKRGFSSQQLDRLGIEIKSKLKDTALNTADHRVNKKTTKYPTNSEIQRLAKLLKNGDSINCGIRAHEMVERYPTYPLGWKVLSLKKEVDGQPAEAIYAAQKAIKLDSLDDEAHRNLAVLYKKFGKYDEAGHQITKAIDINPTNSAYKIILARIAELKNNVSQAGTIFAEITKKESDNAELLNEYGNFLYRTGEVQQAANIYKSASQLSINNADILVNLGKALHAVGQYHSAKQALLEALTISPNEETANHTLGVLYYEEQNYDAATSYLKKTKNQLSQSYLLRCYLEKGSLTEFQKQLGKINKSSNVNAMVGSLVDRAVAKYRVELPNPFTEDAFKYVYKRALDDHCNFDETFGALSEKILADTKISRRSQPLLRKGEQTAGNLFKMDGKLVRDAEMIIRSQINEYQKRFATEKDGYITKWPDRYKLHGWLIYMSAGGSLAPHIHETGWLSGAVYIKVPKKADSNEGNFVVCLDDDIIREDQRKIIDVNSRDIVLFPASLMHYTIPFSSTKARLVLAFDLIPC